MKRVRVFVYGDGVMTDAHKVVNVNGMTRGAWVEGLDSCAVAEPAAKGEAGVAGQVSVQRFWAIHNAQDHPM
eukprot:15057198-Heterocapsa_arctica.AAC.1